MRSKEGMESEVFWTMVKCVDSSLRVIVVPC